MKQLIALSILPFLFALVACKSSKSYPVIPTAQINTPNTTEVKIDATKWIAMSKGACYGKCPVYTMTILENGVVQFMGKRFCTMLGPHTAQLSNQQMKSLEQDIAGIQIEELPDRFESNVADFPSTEITFYQQDDSPKSVWWNMNASPKIVDLSSVMENYMTKLDWKIDNNAPLPEGAIGNQFLIYLEEGVSASDFAEPYSDYDFIPKKEVTPGQNYWLFEFDTNKIPPYEMYNLVSKSENTQSVKFNTKVSER